MEMKNHKAVSAAALLFLGGVFVAGVLPLALSREYVATVDLAPVLHGRGEPCRYGVEASPRVVLRLDERLHADWNAESLRRCVLSSLGRDLGKEEADRLVAGMAVEPCRSRGVVRVTAASPSVQEALLVANAYSDAVVRHLEEMQTGAMRGGGVEQLKEILGRTRHRRELLEGKVAALHDAQKAEADELLGELQAASNRCAGIGRDIEKMESTSAKGTSWTGMEAVSRTDGGSVEAKWVVFGRWRL